MIPTDFAISSVPFLIYDLTEPLVAEEALIAPGFYWSIPLPEDDDITGINVMGPLATRQEAIDAAGAFIRDALNEHPAGEKQSLGDLVNEIIADKVAS